MLLAYRRSTRTNHNSPSKVGEAASVGGLLLFGGHLKLDLHLDRGRRRRHRFATRSSRTSETTGRGWVLHRLAYRRQACHSCERNSNGDMVPLGSLVTLKPASGASLVSLYNLYPSATITGVPAPGFSSGEAIDLMEQTATNIHGRPRAWLPHNRVSPTKFLRRQAPQKQKGLPRAPCRGLIHGSDSRRSRLGQLRFHLADGEGHAAFSIAPVRPVRGGAVSVRHLGGAAACGFR
jgi:hypothetical protein